MTSNQRNELAERVSEAPARPSKRRRLDVDDGESSNLEPLTLRSSAPKKPVTYGKSRRRSAEHISTPESPMNSEKKGSISSKPISSTRRRAAFASTSSASQGSDKPLPPSSNSHASPTATTSVENHSHIFDLVLGSSNESSTPATPRATRHSGSSTPTSGRRSQREVARSRTDPALFSPSTRTSRDQRKSSSMPSIPSSPTRPSVSPVKPISAASGRNSTAPQVPTVSRTYSGRSRSFLISVSSSQYGVVPGAAELDEPGDTGTGEDEDDADARESYASLRSRWGVDRSDDDRYHLPTLPSKTPVSSSEKSPVKPTISFSEPPPLPDGMMNDLKSTNELRSKGESRKFLDEVGYLFEGLEPDSPLGLKRSSALEILKKLCDDDFAKKANATDFYVQTATLLYECGAALLNDKILNAIFVIFIFLVSRDLGSFTDLLRRPIPATLCSEQSSSQLLQMLGQMLPSGPGENDIIRLSITQDIASLGVLDLKKAGLRRQDKPSLRQISDIIKLITKDSACTEVSTSFLITEILVAAPSSDLPVSLIHPILSSLPTSLSILQPKLDALKSSTLSGKVENNSSFILPQVNNLLKLLDDFLIGRWTLSKDEEIWIGEDLVDWLLDLWMYSELSSKHYGPHGQTTELLTLCLRLLLNITHDISNTRFHTRFSQLSGITLIGRQLVLVHKSGITVAPSNIPHPGVKKEEEREEPSAWLRNKISQPVLAAQTAQDQQIDQLCLVLGILTNILQGEAGDQVKHQLRQTMISFKCPLSGACYPTCSCPVKQHESILYHLVKVYSECQDSTLENPAFSSISITDIDSLRLFVQGHLVILFGLLMQNSTDNQVFILHSLPDSVVTEKVSRLINHAVHFAEQYRVFLDSQREETTPERLSSYETSHLKLILNTVDFLHNINVR